MHTDCYFLASDQNFDRDSATPISLRESNSWTIRRRFQAVTLTIAHLTLNIWNS